MKMSNINLCWLLLALKTNILSDSKGNTYTRKYVQFVNFGTHDFSEASTWFTIFRALTISTQEIIPKQH
jgi:beta-lactamase class D